MPLDCLILTPTTSVENLDRLVSRFNEERRKRGLTLVHVVVDCGGNDKRAYRNLINDWHDRGYPLTYSQDEQDGELWRIWGHLFSSAKWQEFCCAIGVSDDLVPCNNFLRRSARYFKSARAIDPRCIGVDIGVNKAIAFIVEKKFFQILRFGIKATDRAEVWQGIVKRIVEANYTIATSTKKLLIPGPVE